MSLRGAQRATSQSFERTKAFMFEIAGYKINAIISDYFRLDGGAMFGSVPKPLWEKRIQADQKNRIKLACRLLLLEKDDLKILVDVGMGTQWQDKEREIFAIENQKVEIPKPTDVILTHLHFDHAGAIAGYLTSNIHVSKVNYEHARNPGPREKVSYRKADLNALNSASVSLTINGDQVFKGIRVYQANGHTHGLQWLKVGEGKGSLVYVSDLIPTAHHLQIPYVMGYDLCAETSMCEKLELLEQVVKDESIVVFEHDAETAACTVEKDAKGRFVIGKKIKL